uniref:Retrovirus-related Pol polyprotein from transposon TNT 1-94 n=1 Tax=Cajanus cajan TaxID=3821 RepID=A0A151QMF9_CAJCA|nr:Retrovirus-related Pol polyprotein from transposon TNT 1-94 [Cajanus cajan]
MWDTLALTYEGSLEVKRNKLSLLARRYELFEMEESESIQTMFGRFQTIVNELSFLGRTYDNFDHIDKLLRSLPRKWRPQVTTLKASKNLEKLSLEELIGLLKVHELELQQDDARRKQKSITLNVQKTKSTPTSSRVLKVEETSDESCTEGTCDTDDEISFLSRKIHLMMKKKGGIRWRKYSRTSREKAQPLCFEEEREPFNPNWQMKAHQPQEQIIGEAKDAVRTRSLFKTQAQIALLSQVEPRTTDEALSDESWVQAMQEEHSTLFRKEIKDDFIIVQIYIDDIIFGATNEVLCQEFSKLMQDEFKMSMMGELKFFLGLQIIQSNEGIKIHQTKYTKELLQKFKMEDAKPMKTLMHPSTTLGLDEESPDLDSTMYQGMVGSFLYLTASRPDIMFSVCVCARFQVRPKKVHLQAVKRILRYLKGTANLGINFYRSQNFSLLGFCDANYAGDKWERKSTSGGCHFLGRCLVSWTSKRQSTIALSTCEAEYVIAGQCLTQLLWIKHQLEDYDIYESSILILYDNTTTINISKNPVLHSTTKHIEIKHHFIRDHVQKGTFELIKPNEQADKVITLMTRHKE